MKEILIEIDKAAKGELERANEKYPLFHSDHEGISVIFEEIDEVNFNLAQSEDYRGKAWEAIKQDDTANAAENIALMRMQLCYAAAEMIQVIAMCEKFIKSQEARRCQQK